MSNDELSEQQQAIVEAIEGSNMPQAAVALLLELASKLDEADTSVKRSRKAAITEAMEIIAQIPDTYPDAK
jgi:hypothetical protein